MKNLELIDAYLRDELDTSQKSSFEQAMASDPNLKGEFEFQSKVVDGIREARKVELKAMLDKVAVGGSSAQHISGGKVVVTLIIAGLAGWGIYNFSSSSNEGEFLPIAQESEDPEDLIIENIDVSESETVEPKTEAVVDESLSIIVAVDEEVSGVEVPNDTEAVISEPNINKPELITGFEGDGNESDSILAPGSVTSQEDPEEMSSIEVSVDNTKKKFTFHYQFKNGRLFLYGDFSSDLYEILEFNTDEEKALFLFYKGKFYDLNSNNERIIELKAVKSKALIAKLEEARTGN